VTKRPLKDFQEKKLSCITKEEGEQMAKKINAFKYLECSSLTQEGLKQVFDESVRCIMAPPFKKKKGRCEIM